MARGSISSGREGVRDMDMEGGGGWKEGKGGGEVAKAMAR